MESLLFAVLVLALLVAVSVRFWKLLPKRKGMTGEALVGRELETQLPKPAYTLFHDITLSRGSGTMQIDHVVVSEFGVFVVETKDRAGWISGSPHMERWTQALRRGRRVTFQNPLRENDLHVKVLGELLGLEAKSLHSIVVFTGGALFNSSMPENVVMLRGLIPFITNQSSRVITPPNVQRLSKLIASRRFKPGATTAELVDKDPGKSR